jgi:hypothetical protein
MEIDAKNLTKEHEKMIVDELMYRNYTFNRERTPHIPVRLYKLVFSNVDDMEQRYQAEKGMN